MKRVCCLCDKKLGEVSPFKDKEVTHGLCTKCVKLYDEGNEKALERVLNKKKREMRIG